jgi:hypothetical protein
MKVLLEATIGLLVVVSAGLAVYAYTEHREVSYLTLRTDHLESRINELESTPSTVDRAGEDEQAGGEESQGTYCDRNPDKRACLPYDSGQPLEAQIARLEEHVAAQNSAIARLRRAPSSPSMNAPYIPSMSEIRREIDSAIYNQSLRDGIRDGK